MAIFGDLSDMSALEVLHMLGSRTGKLFIRPSPDKLYELHLCEGAILNFKDDGFAVYDTADLHRSIKTILELRGGEFEFSQTLLNALQYEINFSRQDIWQLAATLETESESLNAPDKATRFKLKGGFNTEIRLPDDLYTFMQNAHDHLFLGSSASDLAEPLGLPVTQIQMYFQRLRSLGRITPVRAYATTYSSYTPPRPPPEASMAALRARPASRAAVYRAPPQLLEPAQPSAMEMTPLPTRPASTPQPISETRPAPTALRAPPPQPERPKRSFIRRLLSVLSFGGK